MLEEVFHLCLVFQTRKKTPYTIIIRHPKMGLPAPIIRQVMETIVRLGMFQTPDGPLMSVHNAYYIRTKGYPVRIYL